MFLTAPGTDPFKMNQMDKTLKSNLQAQSSSLKQKIFKTMYVRKLYIIENSLNCRMKYSKYSFLCSDKVWESLYVFKERVRQSSISKNFPPRDTIIELKNNRYRISIFQSFRQFTRYMLSCSLWKLKHQDSSENPFPFLERKLECLKVAFQS
jgi:hypothetical protein